MFKDIFSEWGISLIVVVKVRGVGSFRFVFFVDENCLCEFEL